MRAWAWIICITAVWLIALALNRRGVRRHDGGGDANEGILLFVEPVRWLFIIWGFRSFCVGLRRAGWCGQTRLFRWSTTAGALLVIPDVVQQHRLIRRAQKLARLILRISAQRPGVPIHVCGYSSGCYLVLE